MIDSFLSQKIFKRGVLCMVSLTGILTGCSSDQIQHYKDEKPTLVLEDYLNGTLEAHGFFQDRSGLIVKRFHVAMKATWKDKVGTLEEEFKYSDGTQSKRVWSLKKDSNGKYIGTAGDVVGEAKGETAGNAFHWKYTLNLPVGNKIYEVQLDDWMYLMNDEVMLNKSKMSKFGINVGEITLVFLKKKP